MDANSTAFLKWGGVFDAKKSIIDNKFLNWREEVKGGLTNVKLFLKASLKSKKQMPTQLLF